MYLKFEGTFEHIIKNFLQKQNFNIWFGCLWLVTQSHGECLNVAKSLRASQKREFREQMSDYIQLGLWLPFC